MGNLGKIQEIADLEKSGVRTQESRTQESGLRQWKPNPKKRQPAFLFKKNGNKDSRTHGLVATDSPRTAAMGILPYATPRAVIGTSRKTILAESDSTSRVNLLFGSKRGCEHGILILFTDRRRLFSKRQSTIATFCGFIQS